MKSVKLLVVVFFLWMVSVADAKNPYVDRWQASTTFKESIKDPELAMISRHGMAYQKGRNDWVQQSGMVVLDRTYLRNIFPFSEFQNDEKNFVLMCKTYENGVKSIAYAPQGISIFDKSSRIQSAYLTNEEIKAKSVMRYWKWEYYFASGRAYYVGVFDGLKGRSTSRLYRETKYGLFAVFVECDPNLISKKDCSENKYLVDDLQLVYELGYAVASGAVR